jgi:hypothetical protein
MSKTLQISKHKWQSEKFWAFMLLGLNRMLNHDFLPPWGFEFLLRVNTQAWWYYSHYGFGAKYEPDGRDEQEDGESLGDEPESRDKQEDAESLSDEASVGERSTSSSRTDTKPHDDWARSEFRDYAHSNRFLRVPDRQDPERVLECASSKPGRFGAHLYCSICCTWVCAQPGSCRKEKIEIAGLLPKFDWEEDDGGHNFGHLS